MLNTVARRSLAPLLRLAKLRLDQSEQSLPEPSGPPQVHVPGGDPYRILIVGNGVALGRGVRSHDLALPGHLARAVSTRMRCGVDVAVIAAPRLSLSGIASAIRRNRPWRYDAIVIVAGSEEAVLQQQASRWRTRLTSAIRDTRSLVSPGVAVIVCGIPATHHARRLPSVIAGMADAHAHALDTVSREVCGLSAATQFVPLIPEHGDTRIVETPAELYRLWANDVAQRLASGRTAPGDRPHEVHPHYEERVRQAAVDRLHFDREDLDPALTWIVERARELFGTETALFTILDRDTQLHVARAGSTRAQVPRSDSFCNYTILDANGLVVEDATLDDRFSANPLVTGDPHIRFYAGFPIDSPDGERVGALCVYDSKPRQADDVDRALLRELALLVQNELWRYVRATDAALPQLTR